MLSRLSRNRSIKHNVFNISRRKINSDITIHYINNGRGLTTDKEVLETLLLEKGFKVESINGRDPRFFHQKLHIFLEILPPISSSYNNNSQQCLLIPNLEWINSEQAKQITQYQYPLLAKTEYGFKILSKTFPHNKISYLPWISTLEERDLTLAKEPLLLHVSGPQAAFDLKNTKKVINVFNNVKNLTLIIKTAGVKKPHNLNPKIKWINEYYTKKELEALITSAQYIMQPSKTEGFGHCIYEPMTWGKPIITLDAQPMNELVSKERGFLVPSNPTKSYLGLIPENRINREYNITKLLDSLPNIDSQEYLNLCQNSHLFTRERVKFFKENFTETLYLKD